MVLQLGSGRRMFLEHAEGEVSKVVDARTLPRPNRVAGRPSNPLFCEQQVSGSGACGVERRIHELEDGGA